MAKSDSRIVASDPDPQDYDTPAVAVDAADATSNEVAGAILRAMAEGHHSLVVNAHLSVGETVEFADRLGASVVDSSMERMESDDRLVDVIETAREIGFPGVIYQTDPTERIDFPASVERLRTSSDYVVDARLEPVLESSPNVLVGIPAYNEESSIGDVVRRAAEYASAVLVVDDGSSDETSARAQRAGATVIRHDRNRGYGASLKSIFREADRARADQLVILDGDGQHDPRDIPRLVEAQEASTGDIVIASRFIDGPDDGVPLYRRFGLSVVNLLTNVSLGAVRRKSRVSDTQSGFRAYNRESIQSLSNDELIGEGMSASTDILYHAHVNDFEIEEVDTSIRYDVENASSQDPISHGFHLVNNLLRTIETEHPILVLGVPGFVSTVIGIGFGYATFHIFLADGVFPIGHAVTSVFFGLAGIFAAFTAIILHALNQHRALRSLEEGS